MAIRTGEIFNSLIFGGVNSADYGIYITGEGTFNAPKRLVNMVSVPGRNGSVAIDQGHWDNVTVEYPAGVFGDGIADFREAMSNFRNAICSQIGYQRLADTYHPDEYRMALYIDGLEVDPVAHNAAGEFTLKFNCKPQRWLTSGETAVTVTSGGVLTNPTPYNAGPLLMAEGYGTIGFNGYEIELERAVMGNIIIHQPDTSSEYVVPQEKLQQFNDGDTITIGQTTFPVLMYAVGSGILLSSITSITSSGDDIISIPSHINVSSGTGRFNIIKYSVDAYKGATTTKTANLTVTGTTTAGQTFTVTLQVSITANLYDSDIRDNRRIKLTVKQTEGSDLVHIGASGRTDLGEVSGYSTVVILGHPTYIDCEIGETYKEESGKYILLNQFISFGSDLPILKSGDNEITFDATITELKVKPNWWKL